MFTASSNSPMVCWRLSAIPDGEPRYELRADREVSRRELALSQVLFSGAGVARMMASARKSRTLHKDQRRVVLRVPTVPVTVRGEIPSKSGKGALTIMDIAVLAQLLSSLATFVVAAGILYQGGEARRARNDEDRPQIIVDADYTGRFTTNIVVRNITFAFSAPLQSTSGYDITELPYFKHGINFMAPQTSLPAVWDSYQNVVKNLKDKGLTEGITITSYYEDRQGERYETEWTINPLLLEGSGYSDYKGYEDEVQALQDQAKALERISEDLEVLKETMNHPPNG